MKAVVLLVASVLGCSAVPADPPSEVDAGSATPTVAVVGAEAPGVESVQAATLVDRYDFGRRTDRFDLPGRLDEISGLATTPDGRLFAHDDERGRVHEILPATGEVGKRFDLGDDMVRDDFEGIAIAGARFFLISSRGWLYEFAESGDETATGYRVTDTGVGGSCEVEGLDYDEAEQALLIACKVATPDRGTIVVHRLPLDPERPRLAALTIARTQLEAFGVDPDFQPSALAVDPVGTIVLVSGRHEAIIEVDRAGRVLAGYALSPGRHPQPEGVEFGPDRTLYISDERNGQPARVTAYAPVRPGGAR